MILPQFNEYKLTKETVYIQQIIQSHEDGCKRRKLFFAAIVLTFILHTIANCN